MIGSMFTPDGADWGEANLKEMQELIEEISWFPDGGNTNPLSSFIISM
jgi:hypothetical protein